jgi:hypothetical protein
MLEGAKQQENPGDGFVRKRAIEKSTWHFIKKEKEKRRSWSNIMFLLISTSFSLLATSLGPSPQNVSSV